METKKAPIGKHALQQGLVLGIALIIFYLVLYVAGINVYGSTEKSSGAYLSYLSYVIIIVGLFLGIKSYRDKALGGAINFGRALGFGTLMSLFAAIVLTIYTILFIFVIDPDVMQGIYQLAEEQMIEKGLPDETIEKSMEITRMVTVPMMIIGIIVGNTLGGTIISLILGAILKKGEAKNAFEKEMQGIDTTTEEKTVENTETKTEENNTEENNKNTI